MCSLRLLEGARVPITSRTKAKTNAAKEFPKARKVTRRTIDLVHLVAASIWLGGFIVLFVSRDKRLPKTRDLSSL